MYSDTKHFIWKHANLFTVSISIKAWLFKCPHVFSLSPARNSEGVIAYYWSQFDIPVKDLEYLPQFSEERVLETLQNGIVGKRATQGSIDIEEVTASCRYPGGGQVGQSPRGGALAWTTAPARDPDIKR